MSEVVAVISDLIFRSRVEGATRAAGRALSLVDGGAAPRFGPDVRTVIVDMDLPQEQSTAAIQAAAAAGVPTIIAFYAHVNATLAQRARECGANVVLPRSAFVARLPELLADAH